VFELHNDNLSNEELVNNNDLSKETLLVGDGEIDEKNDTEVNQLDVAIDMEKDSKDNENELIYESTTEGDNDESTMSQGNNIK
jgi:hypothetical protein